MKTIITATILLIAASAAGADREKAREDLRASEAAFAAAFAANDPERFATFVAEDAVFVGPGGTLRGREAVVATWSRMMAEPKFSWEPSRVEVNDDATIGTTTGPVRDLEGRHVGSFASVWRRLEGGRWQVFFDGAPDCPRPAN